VQAIGGAGQGLLSTFGRARALGTEAGQTTAAQDLLASKVASGAADARTVFDASPSAGTAAANTPAGGGGVFPVGESPIPGVTRTLPERTQNPDVAQVYRTVASANPGGPIAAAEAQNTAARTSFLNNMVGTPDDIRTLDTARNNATSTLYAQAADATIPVDSTLTGILGTRMGKQALADAQELHAMREAVPETATGLPFFGGTEDAPTITGRGLQDIKLSLDGLASNAMSGENPALRNATGNLRSSFMNWAGEQNPVYRQANETFAQMSQPINEMQYLQSQKLANVGGNATLSQVDGLLNRITQNAASDKFGAGSVSPQTLANLTNLRDDMRISSAAQGLGKAGGSETFQHLAQNYLNQSQTGLGRVVQRASSVAGKALGSTAGAAVGGTPGAIIGGALGESWDAGRRAAQETASQGLLQRLSEQVVHPDAVSNVGAALARRNAAALPQLPAALAGPLGSLPGGALPNIQAGLLGLIGATRARGAMQ
jgi:hypothetical protein